MNLYKVSIQLLFMDNNESDYSYGWQSSLKKSFLLVTKQKKKKR